MTDFKKAYSITMENEGGYSNDPRDHGGETWRGIARNSWGNWNGWVIVDSIKAQHPTNLSRALAAVSELEPLVLAFYQIQFWDSLKLTLLKCQQTANQLFDISVNMGVATGAKMLQSAINQSGTNLIVVDGNVGPQTIMAANGIDEQVLYDKINALRENKYLAIIANNPSQAVFKKGWLNRIKPFDLNYPNMA